MLLKNTITYWNISDEIYK